VIVGMPTAPAMDRTRDEMADRALIERFLKYWVAGDVEQVVSLLSDDVVYQLFISQTALPYGGEWRGPDAVKDVFFDMLATFDCIEFEPTILYVTDGRARCQSRYVYRHRASGEWLTGTSRLVVRIRDGAIERLDEFHDDALLQAFARLANQRARERTDPLKGWKP
jgi:ketosteroid isomerase-like protein